MWVLGLGRESLSSRVLLKAELEAPHRAPLIDIDLKSDFIVKIRRPDIADNVDTSVRYKYNKKIHFIV